MLGFEVNAVVKETVELVGRQAELIDDIVGVTEPLSCAVVDVT